MSPARPLRLTIAVGDHPATRALKDGRVRIDGVEAEFLSIKPQIAAFRRMVRDLEFDICELAATTYIIARAHRLPIKALPVFLHRRFHHGEVLIRPDAGIAHPRDLAGKKVGVRAYSVTTGVWSRTVLNEEFGLDLDKVTWVVDDEEHVQAMRLPPNVIHTAPGVSLAQMMAAGDLQAGYSGNAGVGREGNPTGGWQDTSAGSTGAYLDLIPDPGPLEADWYRRTGIYPMHGTVVLKEALLTEHPWLGQAVAEAFEEAKRLWLIDWRTGLGESDQDRMYRRFRPFVGDDPLPNGLERNRQTVDALQRTSARQGLIPAPLGLDELFHPLPAAVFGAAA